MRRSQFICCTSQPRVLMPKEPDYTESVGGVAHHTAIAVPRYIALDCTNINIISGIDRLGQHKCM